MSVMVRWNPFSAIAESAVEGAEGLQALDCGQDPAPAKAPKTAGYAGWVLGSRSLKRLLAGPVPTGPVPADLEGTNSGSTTKKCHSRGAAPGLKGFMRLD